MSMVYYWWLVKEQGNTKYRSSFAFCLWLTFFDLVKSLPVDRNITRTKTRYLYRTDNVTTLMLPFATKALLFTVAVSLLILILILNINNGSISSSSDHP